MKYLYRIAFRLATFYWFVCRPNTYGAGVIVVKGNEVLMVRHTYGKRQQWGFPGGGKKINETDRQTASRELKEELGLNLSLTKIGSIKAQEDYRHVHGACFKGTYNGQPIQSDRKEIAEVKWWAMDKLPADLSPATIECINIFRKQRSKLKVR